MVEADNGSYIAADGLAYVHYTNGDKLKYEANISELKNIFFTFDTYVHATFDEFDSYSLSVEYDSVTLTLSGLSKDAFIEKALDSAFMSTEEFSAFCESITEYSYSTDIVFDNDGNVIKIVRKYSYTYAAVEGEPIDCAHEYTAIFSAEADELSVPEDADNYIFTVE